MNVPRSPRLRGMLDVLQSIYQNPDTPPAERMEAIKSAQRILNRKSQKRPRKSKSPTDPQNALRKIQQLEGNNK